MAVRHKNKNGDGYCRKIEKGRWECTIMSKYINPRTGNEKRVKRVGATEDEARRNAKQALKAWEKEFEKNHANFKVDKAKTFGQYVDEYLVSIQNTITDSCYRSYCSCMKRYFFSHPISNLQLHMLSCVEFQNYYDDMASHYSRKTCKMPMQLCRRTCKELVARNLLPENYAEQASLKVERADEYIGNLESESKKEIFTEEDIRRFYEAFKQHRGQYAVVAIFLLETGMRTSEFAALQNSDVDLDKMIITVQKARGTRYKDPVNRTGVEEYIKVPKNAKPRIIPISPVCLECIQEMQQQTEIMCRDNHLDLLYPTFRNGRMRSNATMEVGFKSLCDSLGIDRGVTRRENGTIKGLCLHSLRHTANSFMRQQSASTSTIASILGHSDEIGEKIYTHSNIDMVKGIKTTSQVLGIGADADNMEADDADAAETTTVEMTKEDLALFRRFKAFMEQQNNI